MRKVMGLTIGFVVLLSSMVFAQNTRTNVRVYDLASGTTTFSLRANSVSYTDVFPLAYGEFFGLSYKVQSANGTPNVRMQLEQSYRMPDIANDADSYWVVPDNMADIVTGLTSETQHHISLSPAPTPYARIKITEAGAQSDTNITLKVTVIGQGTNSN